MQNKEVVAVTTMRNLRRAGFKLAAGQEFQPFDDKFNENSLDALIRKGRRRRSAEQFPFHHKQIATYGVILQDNAVLVPENIHGEPQLAGLTSFGFGGHLDHKDTSLREGFIREVGEEIRIKRGEEVISLDMRKGGEDATKFFVIEPAGVIFTRRTNVDKRHVGVLYLMELKNSEDRIVAIAPDGSHSSSAFINIVDFTQATCAESVNLASWPDIIVREVFARDKHLIGKV